jgi:tetratricopeptide (TPR) repeat protein
MKFFFILLILPFCFTGYSQIDSAKINRINAINYNNKGLEYHRAKNYSEAIIYFNKAIQCDSSYADAYYNKAVSSVYARPEDFIDFDKCKEFEKAIKLGKKISDDELFFYGCNLKKNKGKKKGK